MISKNRNIILFDGVCNLCEASVAFIIKHDTKNHFYFASQSSTIGKALLKQYGLEEADTIVVIAHAKAYLYSDAALEISRHLEGGYRYLYLFRFVPKGLRDALYRLVAKYRYRVFGKKERCMMPTKSIEKRFLS